MDTGATWDETSAVAREWCRELAQAALAAADEADAPIAEKLAAALRDFIVYCEHYFSHTDSRAPWPTVEKARAALAEFEKLRASAPVENPE